MTMLRVYDRVRLTDSAARALPDGHSSFGTVVGTWIDPAGVQRVDVTFDGEDDPVPGHAASDYELIE